MRIITTLKLVIAASLLVCGCAKSGSGPVGVWSNTQTPETVEFKADRSGVFVVKDQPSLAFTWTTLDNNRVKVDISFHGSVRTLLGRVDGDDFVLDGSGQRATYHRMKQ